MATDIIARGMAGSTKKALDEYKNNPDVSDIVATKSDLTNYDTSKLNVNDIVKVLVDESQNNKQTYYKWTGTTFQYVGGLGPYYTTSEIDDKIDESHCYLIGDTDLNVYTGEISSRFKNIIDNRATFKYVGTDNGGIIKVNNTNAINKTFIPIEDKDADHNGFYLYQTTYISVDTGQPEISIIRFYVSNSNILTTDLAAHSSFSDIGWISPQIIADSDDYIYLDQEGILCIPNLYNALMQEIDGKFINGTKIFNFQLLDSNNLINTLPEDTKIFLGNPDSTILPLLDINSNVNFNTGELVAPIMTVGSIKRFRICDDDPILKDSYIFSGYIYSGGKGIVVITERSSGGSGALYRHKVMFGESLAEGQSHITFLNGNPTPYTAETFFQFLQQYIASQSDDILIPEISGWGNTALSSTQVFNYTLSAVVISQDEIGLRVMGYPSMTVNPNLDDVIYHDFSQIDLSTDFSDTVTPCLNIGSGSSTSEKVYEFELTTNIYDGSSGVNTPSGAWNKINAVITETQFNELLTNINTAMSTSFTTPQEIVALYDSLKRDDFTDDMQTFYLLNGLIAYVCHYAIEREKPAIRTCWNSTNEDVKMVITNASIMSNGSGNIHHQYYSANVQPFTNNYFDTAFSGDISKMAFDTNSTLTITEKYETIGGGSSEDTGVSLLPININEFTHQSGTIYTRTFTDSEISTLKSSPNVKVKLTGVYADDTLQVEADKNYALLTYTMRQEGTFGLEDAPTEVNTLYYAGELHTYNMILKVYLIVDALSKVGTLIQVQALTSLNVNEGTNNFVSFYAPTSLGNRGTVLVSTGDTNDPFEWTNIAVKKKQVFFGYTSSTAKDISKVLQNNKLSTITYDYYNSLGRYIQHNLIYKFSWNLTDDTYELELYYIDGGQLVLLEPGVNTATAPHICIEYIEE